MSKSLPVKEVCKSYDEIHDGKTMNILGVEKQIGEKVVRIFLYYIRQIGKKPSFSSRKWRY